MLLAQGRSFREFPLVKRAKLLLLEQLEHQQPNEATNLKVLQRMKNMQMGSVAYLISVGWILEITKMLNNDFH